VPKRVFGHGFLLFGTAGEKMSKSRGNVVDPFILIDRYGLDAVRYYLLREVPFGSDGNYTEDALILRTNVDLANDLGNLLSRTTAMIEKFAGGKVPAYNAAADDRVLSDLAASVIAEYETAIERLEISNAVATLWKLVGRANKYIDEQAPWALAKDPAKAEKLGTVLYSLAESLRILAVTLTPVLIHAPGRIWDQLGLDPAGLNRLDYDAAKQWGGLPAGTAIRRGDPIFPRIEAEKAEEAAAPEPAPVETNGAIGEIEYEDFARVELKVAKIVAAEKVPKADKLLKLTLDVGGRSRTIVSGIAQHYQPEELTGRLIVIVANLKPKALRGIESHGMLLAASTPEGNLSLVTLDAPGFPSGSKVK
jgi:methionyl-tRNA synthetase